MSVQSDRGGGVAGLYRTGLVSQHVAIALTLVAVGPLTNVATAMQREPSLVSAFREVVVMGGAFRHPGNVTPYAEFNISVDPEAAKSTPFGTTIAHGFLTLSMLTHLSKGTSSAAPDAIASTTSRLPTPPPERRDGIASHHEKRRGEAASRRTT